MHRLLGKPTYPNCLEAYKNGEFQILYDPTPPDRAPGWRAREKEKQKRKQQDWEDLEKMYAERKDRKKRDDLERQLRDRRKMEGRVLSQIVPTPRASAEPQAPHAGGDRMPAREVRSAAPPGWGPSTRPEYRTELDASSSSQRTTRPYELEAATASQQFKSNAQPGQRPRQQDQRRSDKQRFELMGDFPGENSRPPQSSAGSSNHTGPRQQNTHPMPPRHPQERLGNHTPDQPHAGTSGHRTADQRPIHYPPGFFENPRTPPKISKPSRRPSELNIW